MADQDGTPVLDVLTSMTATSIEATKLDPRELMLVRFAALVAQDASPVSYLFQFGAGAELGMTSDDARQVLVALAPLVGSARIVSAASKLTRALGLAVAISESLQDAEISESDVE